MKGILFLLIGLSLFTQSEISSNPNDWYGVTDRVMGGKSNLQVEFVEETFILRGNVTTQNNGGFVRLVQDIKLNDDSLSGISFQAKGNDEVYEIHATLKGMKIPPWSYMSRSFQVTDKWKRYEIYFIQIIPNPTISSTSILSCNKPLLTDIKANFSVFSV